MSLSVKVDGDEMSVASEGFSNLGHMLRHLLTRDGGLPGDPLESIKTVRGWLEGERYSAKLLSCQGDVQLMGNLSSIYVYAHKRKRDGSMSRNSMPSYYKDFFDKGPLNVMLSRYLGSAVYDRLNKLAPTTTYVKPLQVLRYSKSPVARNTFMWAYMELADEEKEKTLQEWETYTEDQRNTLALYTNVAHPVIDDGSQTVSGDLLPGILSVLSKALPKASKVADGAHLLKLNNYPETPLQRVLTVAATVSLFEDRDFVMEYLGMLDGGEGDPSRWLTGKLKPYLTVSDKLMDVRHTVGGVLKRLCAEGHGRFLYELSSDKPEAEHDRVDISEQDASTILSTVLLYIKDGQKLYNTYRPVSGKGVFVKVKGSLLNQYRNSAFNHRTELALSLEEKLKLLSGGRDEPRVSPDRLDEYPEILQDSIMLGVKEVIIAGKECGHCIGSYSKSENWLFRKGTVCARVDHKNGKIVECRDKGNYDTKESASFEKDLVEALTEVRSLGVFTEPLPEPAPKRKPRIEGAVRENPDTHHMYMKKGSMTFTVEVYGEKFEETHPVLYPEYATGLVPRSIPVSGAVHNTIKDVASMHGEKAGGVLLANMAEQLVARTEYAEQYVAENNL